MSDFRDRFERQLISAARRLEPQPHAQTGRGRARRAGLVGSLAALALGAAFVVGLSSSSSPDGNGSSARSTRAVDAPPQEQLDVLGVLRRPPTAADRSPAVRAVVRDRGGTRQGFVRRVDSGAGPPVVLIPLRTWGTDGPRAPIHDALCLYVTNTKGGGGMFCQSFEGVRRGALGGGLGTRRVGIVPDGVATVVIHRLDGSKQRVPVVDNFYDYDDGHRVRFIVDWLDADGRPVPKR